MNLYELRTLRQQVMRSIRSTINTSTAGLSQVERRMMQEQLADKLRGLADELQRYAIKREMYDE
jgi:hypothetical protein